MSTCKRCGHEVVCVTYGTLTIDLDPIPKTWVAVDEHHIFPEDGDRVFLSTALVEHAVVCPVIQREQAQARAIGKQQYDQQHVHKQRKA